jgi:type IV pilus assembly protein PilQ
MKNKKWAVLLALGLLLNAVTAFAAATLMSVQVERLDDGDRVELQISETFPDPSVFAANQGRTVVVDLPGVAALRPRYDTQQQGVLLQNVAVATVQGVTRVVLSQTDAVNYRFVVEGSALVVTTVRSGLVNPSTAAVPSNSQSTSVPAVVEPAVDEPSAPHVSQDGLTPTPAPAPGAQPLAAVTPAVASTAAANARESQPGMTRVVGVAPTVVGNVVAVATAVMPPVQAPVTSVRPPSEVAAGAAAPAAVASAFAPALLRPVARTQPAAVVTPEPAVLPPIASPTLPVATAPLAVPATKNERISLNFQSIDIRSVLQVIADFSGFNVVASDAVKGELTVRLQDVDWREALHVVLDAKGLGVKEQGNLLWVAPKADLLAQQESAIKAQAAQLTLEPLRTEVFRMNFAKADQLIKQLSVGRGRTNAAGLLDGLKDKVSTATSGNSGSETSSLLSQRGSVMADARTNQLFVTDVEASLEKVRQFLQAVDIPVRQVLIEARIVEADDNFSRNLGVKLGVGNTGPITLGPRIQIGNNYNAVSATASSSVLPFVNLPASGINGSAAATFAVSLFGASMSRFLNLEISALEADGRGKVVSSPRIVTADQVKALIEQGTEYPYQTSTSSGATAVEFRKANLKLEVSPQITPQGNIILDVDVNKDSRGETTAAGIAINTKHIKTQVLVENGGTLVIGGILEEYERNEVDKVPGLGDLPLIGNVFKSTRKQIDKTEVVVFITPRVINDNRIGN